MFKAKSNKELWCFLFNDFLLLTYAAKQFTSSGPDKLFSNKNHTQLKMYKPVSVCERLFVVVVVFVLIGCVFSAAACAVK